MERESQEQEARRKLAKGKERLMNIKSKHKAFNLLVDVAADELESASDAYMEADTEEMWQEFNEHCEKACFNLKCAIATLHKLAETEPSQVNPEALRWLRDTINDIGNIRIGFWEKWGQQVKADRDAGRKPRGIWQCPAQVLHGITDMTTVEAAEFCLYKCEYQDRCVLPIPHPKLLV